MPSLYPVIFFILLLAASFPARAGEITLDDYAGGLSTKWQEKSFTGSTRYRVEEEDGQRCIAATSSKSASGLYFRIEYDPREYPVLAWRWKIERVLAKGDARRKEGDDYAARVYVIFPSWLFWKTRAINYIWANRLPKGEIVPNPFTANAAMIAVESGNSLAGKWVDERRNILEDYRAGFGEDPSRVGAVAIMTDTDNTGEEARAWYGPLTISSAP